VLKLLWVSNQALTIRKCCTLPIKILNQQWHLNFLVVPQISTKILLGTDALRKMKLQINFANSTVASVNGNNQPLLIEVAVDESSKKKTPSTKAKNSRPKVAQINHVTVIDKVTVPPRSIVYAMATTTSTEDSNLMCSQELYW